MPKLNINSINGFLERQFEKNLHQNADMTSFCGRLLSPHEIGHFHENTMKQKIVKETKRERKKSYSTFINRG
jgi:hypothetical protein